MIKRRMQLKVRVTINAKDETEYWRTLEAFKEAILGVGRPLPGEIELRRCSAVDVVTDANLSEEITAD